MAGPSYKVANIRRQQFYVIFDEVAVTASSGTQKFFNDVTSKRADQTNLTTAGQLPIAMDFNFIAWSIIPAYGTALADLRLLYNSTAAEFLINGKRVLIVPLTMLTTGCGLEGVAGYNGTGVAAGAGGEYHNGVANPGAIVRFPTPFPIGQGETFGVNFIKDSALTGMTTTNVKCLLHGIVRDVVQ